MPWVWPWGSTFCRRLWRSKDRSHGWARLQGTAPNVSHLAFLGALDCGPNGAAQIAGDLGIARQAVRKKVKELEACVWLQTAPDPIRGNQRVIPFTNEGERMMSEVRALFQQLDDRLFARWDPARIKGVFDLLQHPLDD